MEYRGLCSFLHVRNEKERERQDCLGRRVLFGTWKSWSCENNLHSLHCGISLQGSMEEEKAKILELCYHVLPHTLSHTKQLSIPILLPWRTVVCPSFSFWALNPGIDASFIFSLEAKCKHSYTCLIHHCVQTIFIRQQIYNFPVLFSSQEKEACQVLAKGHNNCLLLMVQHGSFVLNESRHQSSSFLGILFLLVCFCCSPKCKQRRAEF